MIVANVELVSARGRDRDKHQARIEIANVGGSATKADYRYRIFGKRDQVLCEGTIADFPRKKLLAVDLLLICLTDARGSKVLKDYNG